MRIGVISARLGLANGLDDPATIRCFALILIGIDPGIGFRLFLGLFSGQGSVIFYAR